MGNVIQKAIEEKLIELEAAFKNQKEEKILFEDLKDPLARYYYTYQLFTKSIYDQYQLSRINEAINKGFTLEQIYLFADPRFTSKQMSCIIKAIELELQDFQLLELCNVNLSDIDMDIIIDYYELKNKLNSEK